MLFKHTFNIPVEFEVEVKSEQCPSCKSKNIGMKMATSTKVGLQCRDCKLLWTEEGSFDIRKSEKEAE